MTVNCQIFFLAVAFLNAPLLGDKIILIFPTLLMDLVFVFNNIIHDMSPSFIQEAQVHRLNIVCLLKNEPLKFGFIHEVGAISIVYSGKFITLH